MSNSFLKPLLFFHQLFVPKHHLRIESYGTVDELNSYIGLIRDQDISKKDIEVLLEIQDRLFTIGSHLAAEPGKYLFGTEVVSCFVPVSTAVTNITSLFVALSGFITI